MSAVYDGQRLEAERLAREEAERLEAERQAKLIREEQEKLERKKVALMSCGCCPNVHI